MSSAALVSFFQIVTILGTFLTVLKLLTSGLSKRYRIFFIFFVLRVPYLLAALILRNVGQGINSKEYFYLFFFFEPVFIVLYVLVVVELYSLVLEGYKGIYTLGRWVMYASVVVAVAISVISLLPQIGSSMPEPSKKLMYELAAERGVELSLVIFILLIVLFLSRYPVRLNRNVVVHTAIYSVYFLSATLVLLLRTVFGWKANLMTNGVLAALSAACTLGWWLMLSATGEQVQISLPHLQAGSEDRILRELDSLNATLLKVSRK